MARRQNRYAGSLDAITRTSQCPGKRLQIWCAASVAIPRRRYPRRTKNSATSHLPVPRAPLHATTRQLANSRRREATLTRQEHETLFHPVRVGNDSRGQKEANTRCPLCDFPVTKVQAAQSPTRNQCAFCVKSRM